MLYYVILLIFLKVKDLTLIDYKGISEITQGGLISSIFSRIPNTYISFAKFIFHPENAYSTWFFVLLNIAFVVIGLIAFIGIAHRLYSEHRSRVFGVIIAGIILLPPAINLTDLMGVNSEIVRYSFVFIYIIAIVLVDRWLALESAEGKKEIPKIFTIIIFCLGVLFCAFSVNTDNLAYTASATANRATESFATRLVQRVESVPGYKNGMEVVIIGGFPRDVYTTGVEEFDRAGTPADTILLLNKHIYYYLNDWLNVPWEEPDEETFKAVSDSEIFKSMPLYPDDGSIIIMDNMVIVRLAEKYYPKKPYEIQYDERR